MPLEAGLYTIRWVPAGATFPIIGGLYATGESINAPIVAHALGPSEGEQFWNVRPLIGQNDLYTIATPSSGDLAIGWSIDRSFPGNESPVVLSPAIVIWVIRVVDEENSVYQISEPSTIIGATRAVDNIDDQLFTKTYITEPESSPLPKWQFERIDRA